MRAAQTLRKLAERIGDEELRKKFLSAPQARRVLARHYEFLCCFVFHITNSKIDRVHDEYFDLETI